MIGNSPYKEDIARLFREGLELGRLHGKTILVAGATGLVGGCVVDVLMQNPARCYKVIAAGRNKERARQKFAANWEDESFFFAEIDVTQPVIKSMDRMIGEPVYNELAEGADYIIDAASNASPNFFKQNPVEVMKANINGDKVHISFADGIHVQDKDGTKVDIGKDGVFVNENGKWTLEQGEFMLQAGDASAKIMCSKTRVWTSPNK
jgi:hypothetical protein